MALSVSFRYAASVNLWPLAVVFATSYNLQLLANDRLATGTDYSAVKPQDFRFIWSSQSNPQEAALLYLKMAADAASATNVQVNLASPVKPKIRPGGKYETLSSA
ncbi:hypothetical protein FB451DRAFT_1476303 [Mycena latifolia]|nr:hypothetical protein FB451DRAFT_1476303 [Mycena latifolia]